VAAQPEQSVSRPQIPSGRNIAHMTVSRYYDVKRDERGKRYLEPFVEGALLLGLPLLNKGRTYAVEANS